MFETKGQKWEGKSGSQKWEGIAESWRKTFSSYLCIFFFFVSFSCAWEKEDAKIKCLKQKGKNGRAKAGVKSERAEWEFEGKLLSFFAFFFFHVVFLFFSYVWKEENAKKKRLKQKGRSRRQKWEGKTGAWKYAPSLLLVFLLFFCALSSLCLKKRRWQQCVAVFFMVLLEQKRWRQQTTIVFLFVFKNKIK